MRENEHSDNDFHFPAELSDAEMLQLPTQTKATKRKSLLSNQEIKKLITSQQQANTVRKTNYDMNVFQRFLNECGENQKVVEIPHPPPPPPPSEDLNSLLCNFYITAKKKDNSKYEPDTMFSFPRSIQRLLDENNAKVNILKDERTPEIQTLRTQKAG